MKISEHSFVPLVTQADSLPRGAAVRFFSRSCKVNCLTYISLITGVTVNTTTIVGANSTEQVSRWSDTPKESIVAVLGCCAGARVVRRLRNVYRQAHPAQ